MSTTGHRRASLCACRTAIAASLLLSSSAFAQHQTSYKYDALGRVSTVQDQSSGTNTTYKHDAADNRHKLTISAGSGGGGGSCKVTAEGTSALGGLDGPFFVDVRVSDGCSAPVTVNYESRDGSAVAYTHYPPVTGSLTFEGAGWQRIRVYGYASGYELSYRINFSTNSPGASIINSSAGVFIDYP